MFPFCNSYEKEIALLQESCKESRLDVAEDISCFKVIGEITSTVLCEESEMSHFHHRRSISKSESVSVSVHNFLA